MDLDMISIGDRVKMRRKELGLSQTDIYEKCDISSGALSKIENGKVVPSIIAFHKLSLALDCDMSWLATGTSANMQSDIICKYEKELLNNFRELDQDSQEEIMDIIFMKLRRIKRAEKNMAKSYNSGTVQSDKLA